MCARKTERCGAGRSPGSAASVISTASASSLVCVGLQAHARGARACERGKVQRRGRSYVVGVLGVCRGLHVLMCLGESLARLSVALSLPGRRA